MTTAPNTAPKKSAKTEPNLLANLGLLPFASEESAAMPVTVNVRTVVVELPNNGTPRAHGQPREGDQNKRLKRMFQQIASVSDAAKRRRSEEDHLEKECFCCESNP
jgi:hypothetical protein